MFTAKWFFDLEESLRQQGLDSDSQSFDEIKLNLQNPKKLNSFEFAQQAIYVILAGGFSQKTAKIKHGEIISYLKNTLKKPVINELLEIFNNKNKMAAVIKIWENRNDICYGYYKLLDTDSKLLYLSGLPHIGKITANHLARNLGENVVKYDVWIQRLGLVHAGNKDLKIDNGNLNPKIKQMCDNMFCDLENKTGLPKGYLDVVLWRACQNKLIKIPHLLD